MLWIDYSIIIIISLSAIVSLFRGFIKEALSLLAWIIAFFIASNFYTDLSLFLTDIQQQWLRYVVAIAILFISVLLIGSVINHLISVIVQKTGLTAVDRILGLVFGVLRGIFIVSLILFFIDAFTPLNQAHWWQQSVLIGELTYIIEWFFDYLKTDSTLN